MLLVFVGSALLINKFKWKMHQKNFFTRQAMQKKTYMLVPSMIDKVERIVQVRRIRFICHNVFMAGHCPPEIC